MKNGKTLTELAQTLEAQLKTKQDFIADTRHLAALSVGQDFRLKINGQGVFAVNDICHEQLATRLGIPMTYYRRLIGEAKDLLAINLNHWFEHSPDRRMIRTINGTARAFLSERYRPLDNYDLAEHVLPVIQQLGCHVESCELTDRRLYLKCVNQRVEGEIKVGDIVQAGIVISNSEVGCGSVKIEPMVFRLSCKNGLIANDYAMRKYHVGRSGGDAEQEDATIFYKDETRRADDKAFWLKVKDIVEGSLTDAIFQQIIGKMREAQGIKLLNSPIKAVEIVAKRHGLSQDEQTNVLKFLIEGGDLSLYGMVNAVTRAAQDAPEYDRSTDLERLGGIILDQPQLV